MKLKKKKLIIVLLLFAMLANLNCFTTVHADSLPAPFSDVWFGNARDLSMYDFSSEYDLLTTLSFSESTKWPSQDKMPEGFDPEAYLEWTKGPGLGIEKLHEMGYTGKGVNIAYIDQNLGPKQHPDIEAMDLHINSNVMNKWGQNNNSTSMHAPAVLSLMAGRNCGVAPEATVYFVENPAYLADQRSHADCIREIIKQNEKLPEGKKIKVVGFSDNPDEREENIEEFLEAVQEAEEAGIYVYFCAVVSACVADPFSDRDDFASYYAINWSGEKQKFVDGELYVPMDRSVIVNEEEYAKYSIGGLSWTAPQIVGLMAIGLQIDPNQTGAEMFQIMKETAYKPEGMTSGGILNPPAFVEEVERRAAEEQDYYLFLYNGNKVNATDMAAIKEYAETLDKDVRYLDVKDLRNAEQIYDEMKAIVSTAKGDLKGVQIFGVDADVPAFDLHYKVLMSATDKSVIDDMGFFKSDFFYGNLDNQSDDITGFSAYQYFQEGKKLELTLKWPVVRLPLTTGQYKAYFDKVYDYEEAVKAETYIPLTNFSNPIFQSTNHTDDMGYFISERMDEEFNIIESEHYHLYGNLDGDYPVTGEVEGEFSTAEIQKVNEKGITDLLINSHGQWNNVDQAIFVDGEEKRISTLNVNNIGRVLGTNYCNLMNWTCNNAYGLDDTNLSHVALRDSKVLNVFAATTIISNNGVDNKASLEAMKNNNFYYFYYSFMKYYYNGYSRSTSFMKAKNDYVNAIISNSSVLDPTKNYGFNLSNAFTYHHMGLIEIKEPLMNLEYSNRVTTTKEFTTRSGKQEVSVDIIKTKKGDFVGATATIVAEGKTTSKKTKTTVSKSLINKIIKVAGTDSVDITLIINNAKQERVYTVTFNTADLKSGERLTAYTSMDGYDQDVKETGNVKVVTKNGKLSVVAKGSGICRLFIHGRPTGESGEIALTLGSGERAGYAVERLVYEKAEGGYTRFKLTCMAPKGCRVFVFNPPDGDVIEVYTEETSGKMEVICFEIADELLSEVDELTINLYDGKGGSYFVFLNTLPGR